MSKNSYSQEQLVLSLDKSITIALENNPQIKMAAKEVSKAKAGVWESYSTILPQLDASANFQRAWEIQKNTIPNFIKPMLAPLAPVLPGYNEMPDFVELSFGLNYTFNYGAILTQPLYLGGAGVAGIKIAKSAKKLSEHNLELTKQGLIFNTADAFYACILTKEVATVQQEALDQAQANLEVVTKKYNVGTASGFDKMRAEVEVANLKPLLISARNNYQSALTGLRTVLGLQQNALIDVTGELLFTMDEFSDLSLTDMQKLALSNRLEIQSMNEQKDMAQKSITIAKSNFLPKMFFQTDYSFLAMKNEARFKQDDFSKGFTSALSLQVPLFHGFKSSKQYQKAKIDYRITLDNEKQVLDGIAAEVEVTFNKFQEAREKYVSAKESVALAEEALRLANLMYNEGASTQLDVLSSRLARTQSQLNYVTVLYEYQMARYLLRRVTGTLKSAL